MFNSFECVYGVRCYHFPVDIAVGGGGGKRGGGVMNLILFPPGS